MKGPPCTCLRGGLLYRPPQTEAADNTTMNRLLMFIGVTVGGCAGGWAGDCLGLGLMTTFLVSSLGSLAGIVGVWWFMRDYLA